jgi:hypothetical protein
VKRTYKKPSITECSTPELDDNDFSDTLIASNYPKPVHSQSPSNSHSNENETRSESQQEGECINNNSETGDLDALTFTEWMEVRRETLAREHNIITDEQYDLLVSLIRNDPLRYPPPSIIHNSKEYHWAVDVINRQDLIVVNRFRYGKLLDVVVQRKEAMPDGFALVPDVDDGTFYKYYRCPGIVILRISKLII